MTIRSYLKTYETLLNKAYSYVSDDQSELIRDLLSGLEDEAMAFRVAARGHASICAAVKDILIQSHQRDYLRKWVKSKVAAVVPIGEAVLGKAIEELTKSLLTSQKENSDKLKEVLALKTVNPGRSGAESKPRTYSKADRSSDKCYQCQLEKNDAGVVN